MIMRTTTLAWTSCFFLLPFCVGCSTGTDLARVEGTVTMDGKPLANATVVFTNGQTRPSGAITDLTGTYELNFSDREKGAVPGKNIVRITTAQGPSETVDGEPIAAKKETVPMKYNALTTLEFNVEPGKTNVADFALESKGPISLDGD